MNRAAVARAASVVRRRIAAVVPGGKASVAVTSVGAKIFVHVVSRPRISRERLLFRLVGTTARLAFYDWEANVLTASGKTVASQLQQPDAAALTISQGSSSAPPGSPGAGSMSLYEAVRLASRQAKHASIRGLGRLGPEYFAFDAPGSSACSESARVYHVPPVVGQPCYLAGPADNAGDLNRSLPNGVSPSHAQVMLVPQGTVLLEAVSASFSHPAPWSNPTAQFYVLRDRVSLFGNEVTNPQQSTDQSGSPDVTFGFTPKGASSFQNLTAQVAHRGGLVSGFGHDYNQHFAVALDTQLITVPSIDYKAYPDGIQGANGGDITGGFTIGSARDLAAQLRLGWLPINLKLIAVVPRR